MKIGGSAMVTSPNGKGVVLIGGHKYNNDCKAMLELKSDLMEWVPLKQKNVIHRVFYPFAVSIPDDLKP